MTPLGSTQAVPLTDASYWVRGSGLEVVMLLLGSVLLSRSVRWAGTPGPSITALAQLRLTARLGGSRCAAREPRAPPSRETPETGRFLGEGGVDEHRVLIGLESLDAVEVPAAVSQTLRDPAEGRSLDRSDDPSPDDDGEPVRAVAEQAQQESDEQPEPRVAGGNRLKREPGSETPRGVLDRVQPGAHDGRVLHREAVSDMVSTSFSASA